MSVSFCLPHDVALNVFIICRGLCACTEMLVNVCLGSKVRPRTFGCVAMCSAVLFMQVVLSGFSVRLVCFVQVSMVVYMFWLYSCMCM